MGMNTHAVTKRPRFCPWQSPDLTCVAGQVPFPLWGCPSTWGDPTLRTNVGIPCNHLWKMSAMTLISCPPFLPPYNPPFLPFHFSSSFFYFPSSFLLLLYSSLCRPPIMVNNITIIFISCTPQLGWAESMAIILKCQSFPNTSHCHVLQITLIITEKIFCSFVYILLAFPSN